MTAAPTLTLGHTATLGQALLERARHLLAVTFDGEFADHDWDHTLGGIHVLAWHDDQLIGHAAVVQRQLIYRGLPLRTGYVEGVGVHPRWQRRGVGARMMRQLEPVIRRAYGLGALSITDESRRLYERCGWSPWRGPTYAWTLRGLIRTPDEDGSVYVLPCDSTGPLDFTADLACDFRVGDLW
jgi:aminoglycoside 2'-N-acetyltransferase I